MSRSELLPRSGIGVDAPYLVIAPPGNPVISLDARLLDRVELIGRSPTSAFMMSGAAAGGAIASALSVIPVAEIARRWGGLGRHGAAVAVLGWVLAVSCLYEIFEWLLTIVAAGETADRYNGQQGDIWDAQKDMALAALGAILVLAIPRRGGK